MIFFRKTLFIFRSVTSDAARGNRVTKNLYFVIFDKMHKAFSALYPPLSIFMNI